MTTNDPTQPYQSLPLEDPFPPTPESAPEGEHDPYAALRIVNFRRYFVGNAFSVFGVQMAGVAVGWELYSRTNSAVALGMVGLVQVIPIVLLALPAGHLIDRWNRKAIISVATALSVVSYILLGFSSRFGSSGANTGLTAFLNNALASVAHLFGDPSPRFNNSHIPVMFALLLFNGCIRAINQPAKQSLTPMLVPPKILHNAITWHSSMFETCNMLGPATAGFAIAAFQNTNARGTWAYAMIYWFTAFCQLVQLVNISRIRIRWSARAREPMTFTSLLAGVHFVFENKIILSTITLDLFAVLLGGATALLPLFAKDILRVGPIGLGWLRAAPSIGAITTAVVLAHAPPMKNAGRNMLWAVAGFGVATVVFGVSRYFWVSMIALIFTGAFDNISVVVRHTLVQLLTPDAMRGRVSAVNSVFISTSNEMGEFESGITAALGIRLFAGSGALAVVYGPMLAVAGGGVGTILVVATVALLWPQVRNVKQLTAAGSQY